MYRSTRDFVNDWKRVLDGEEVRPPRLTLGAVNSLFEEPYYDGLYSPLDNYKCDMDTINRVRRLDGVENEVPPRFQEDKVLDIVYSYSRLNMFSVPFGSPSQVRVIRQYPIIYITINYEKFGSRTHNLWLQTMLKQALHSDILNTQFRSFLRRVSGCEDMRDVSIEELFAYYI